MSPEGRVQFHMNRPSFTTEHDRLIVEFIFVGEMLLAVSPVNEIGSWLGLIISVKAIKGVKTRVHKTHAHNMQVYVCILEIIIFPIKTLRFLLFVRLCVTNLRVVCKTITCVSAFTEIAIQRHNIIIFSCLSSS